jgi:adenylate cyclase class 2
MNTEIEGKWLNVDVKKIRERLIEIGAELILEDRLMVRQLFDYPNRDLDKQNAWVRLRDEGDKVTLSYKQLQDRTVNGTKEISITVNNFEQTANLLTALGLESKSIQETRRESWKIGSVEVEIDTWPWIPSFVEIEADSEESLQKTAELLGFDYSKVLHGSVETAYQAIYDVTDDELNYTKEIKFMAVPEWLEKKKRK